MATTTQRPKIPGLASKDESVRLFENPILEALTHVHPSIPLIVWTPVIVYLVYLAGEASLSAGTIAGVAGIGLFIWTISEYLLHRYVFHLNPRNKVTARIEYLIHGNHHDYPSDRTRLVMPPAAAIILAAILFSGFRLVLGPVYVLPFFAGFLVGYLCYDYTHYAIHHFAMTSSWGKYLKNHHMKHHFMTHGARWGVSSPLWDLVFGTMKERRGPSHAA